MKIKYEFSDKGLHKNLKKYLDAIFHNELAEEDGIELVLTDAEERIGRDGKTLVLSDSVRGENVIFLPIRRREAAHIIRKFISR